MQEINLYHLLKYYAQNWATILSFLILGLLAGLIYNNVIQTPLYKSEATLLLVNPAGQRTTQDAVLINNYVELFKSRRVLEPVIREHNYGGSYDQLVGNVEAVNDEDTEIIKVAISSDNAKMSQALTEGAVASFKQEAKTLYNATNITTVDEATNPSEPYNVKELPQLGIGATGGLFTSLLLLFFVYDYKTSKNGRPPQPVSTRKRSGGINGSETHEGVKATEVHSKQKEGLGVCQRITDTLETLIVRSQIEPTTEKSQPDEKTTGKK